MVHKLRISMAPMAAAALATTMVVAAPQPLHGAQAATPEHITYIYPYYTASPPRDLQAVQNAINALTTKKINTTVTLQPIAGGSYDQKMQLLFSAGQRCDAVFTAPWTNNFYHLVANGDLLPITKLLPSLAPKTYASLPRADWAAATVNGQIYAVINQQMFPVFWGLLVRKDLATKYHIDVSHLRSLDDVTPILAKLKADAPGITPLQNDNAGGGVLYQPETYGLDPILPGSQNIFIAAIKASGPGLRVVDPSETPAFAHAAKVGWQWHKAGYLPKDLPSQSQSMTEFQAGKFAATLTQVRPSAAEAAKNKADLGYDTVGRSFTKPILTTRSVNSTMTGICRTSAHPQATMRFIELLNSDQQVYNLMAHGVVGKDYVWVDKAKGVIGLPPGQTIQSDGYYPNTDWMFGSQFNAYYTDRNQIGSWAIQRKVNQTAMPSVALGFAPSTDAIKTQVAQVTAVIQEYGEPLVKGLVDPSTALPRYIQALKAAGEDQIIANLQAQVNAWAKANHKR